MNNNDPILDEVKKQLLGTECPDCLTVGEWTVNDVARGVNLSPLMRGRSGSRDFDNPVFLVFFSSCTHLVERFGSRCCGCLQKVELEPSSITS